MGYWWVNTWGVYVFKKDLGRLKLLHSVSNIACHLLSVFKWFYTFVIYLVLGELRFISFLNPPKKSLCVSHSVQLKLLSQTLNLVQYSCHVKNIVSPRVTDEYDDVCSISYPQCGVLGTCRVSSCTWIFRDSLIPVSWNVQPHHVCTCCQNTYFCDWYYAELADVPAQYDAVRVTRSCSRADHWKNLSFELKFYWLFLTKFT
jgi:hypothetical protein